MRNFEKILFSLALTLALVGCSNDDFLTVSDELKAQQELEEQAKTVLTFSMGAGELISKASTNYRAWHTGDPTSFGAYGIYNQVTSIPTDFFNNQEVQREEDPEVFSWSRWKYSPLKYWADYTWCETFDFFAYMPYQASDTSESEEAQNGAKLELEKVTGVGTGTGIDTLKATLSFVVTLKDAERDTIVAVLDSIADGTHNPLICRTPVHKTKAGEVINYQMDQTLAGFSLKFILGDKMSNIRDFVIKEVKITGAQNTIPVGGVVSRTYKYPLKSESAWTADDITWSNIVKNTDKAKATEIPFVDYTAEIGKEGIYDADNRTLRIGFSDAGMERQWGANFYAIPSAEFQPTIMVKYDVTVQDEDKKYITTRRDITSKIVFSELNFPSYIAGGSIGQINPITIKIVPDYLYVLADADQRIGYLVLE